MDEILELEIRRKIYTLIKEHPGLYLSKISGLLKIRISLAEYHLNYLENHDLISCLKDEGYKRYYIKDEIGREDKRILSLLSKKTPLKIVLVLLKYPNIRHRDLIKYFDIAPSTLSYYLKQLFKRGIITIDSENKGKLGYKVVNEKEIIRIITKYEPYNVLDGFKDVWIDFKVE